MPLLRRLARTLAQSEPDDGASVHPSEDRYYEQRMVRALMIAYADIDEAQRIWRLEQFLPYIDNWAICDSLSTTLKQARKDPIRYRTFIETHLPSSDTFTSRFAIVLLLQHFMSAQWMSENLTLLETVTSDHYYVKMAVAWAAATAYRVSPDMVGLWMNCSLTDARTRAMAAQKIRDSQRSRIQNPAP